VNKIKHLQTQSKLNNQNLNTENLLVGGSIPSQATIKIKEKASYQDAFFVLVYRWCVKKYLQPLLKV
jgi:hypothetical protein